MAQPLEPSGEGRRGRTQTERSLLEKARDFAAGLPDGATDVEPQGGTTTRQAVRPAGVVGAASLMPTAAAARVTLRHRADLLAKKEESDTQPGEMYIRFLLGPAGRYGIPYRFLDEILYVPRVSRVPGAPAFVSGVINRRGDLLTVLNLGAFFETEPLSDTSEARILVVHDGNVQLGLLVDAVEDNDEYPATALTPPLVSDGVSKLGYVKGILHGTITMLDVTALLSDGDLTVDEKASP